MKNVLFFWLLALTTGLTACREPNIETVAPTVETPDVKQAALHLTMPEAYTKLLVYPAQSVSQFTIQTKATLAYLARPVQTKAMQTSEYVNGGYRTVHYQRHSVAILPNQDSLKCMMLTVDNRLNDLEILIEDNRAAKWNYFFLDLDQAGNPLTTNKRNHKVTALSGFAIGSTAYGLVYELMNLYGDKLWYSPRDGILKAVLADGRTWQKV
jgi:hypothetical protein